MAVEVRKAVLIAIGATALGLFGWSMALFVGPSTQAVAAQANTAQRIDTDADASPSVRHWQLGSLQLTACELRRPHSGLSTAAWCGALSVPENRADPHSRTIELKLAVLRAGAQVASTDMVVFLAGGPGQPASEAADSVAAALQPVLAHRHVLLLDQRGTGGSHPLTCGDDESTALEASDSFDAEQIIAATRACLRQLHGRADPRFYTTTIALQDLEAVRQALGSPALDVVGVSYGTRVAQ